MGIGSKLVIGFKQNEREQSLKHDLETFASPSLFVKDLLLMLQPYFSGLRYGISKEVLAQALTGNPCTADKNPLRQMKVNKDIAESEIEEPEY